MKKHREFIVSAIIAAIVVAAVFTSIILPAGGDIDVVSVYSESSYAGVFSYICSIVLNDVGSGVGLGIGLRGSRLCGSCFGIGSMGVFGVSPFSSLSCSDVSESFPFFVSSSACCSLRAGSSRLRRFPCRFFGCSGRSGGAGFPGSAGFAGSESSQGAVF